MQGTGGGTSLKSKAKSQLLQSLYSSGVTAGRDGTVNKLIEYVGDKCNRKENKPRWRRLPWEMDGWLQEYWFYVGSCRR